MGLSGQSLCYQMSFAAGVLRTPFRRPLQVFSLAVMVAAQICLCTSLQSAPGCRCSCSREGLVMMLSWNHVAPACSRPQAAGVVGLERGCDDAQMGSRCTSLQSAPGCRCSPKREGYMGGCSHSCAYNKCNLHLLMPHSRHRPWDWWFYPTLGLDM